MVVDIQDLVVVEVVVQDNMVVIYFEIFINLFLEVLDIEVIVKIVKKYGLKIVIDNIFVMLYN